MSENRNATPRVWVDEDDAPELDDVWFEAATLKIGDRPVSNGQLSQLVLLDADLADHFRSGDQDLTRAVNEALRDAIRHRAA